MNCQHEKTRIWEPHLAGARKCLTCGMVYNPNCTPRWFIEPPTPEQNLAVAVKALKGIAIYCGLDTEHLGADNYQDPGFASARRIWETMATEAEKALKAILPERQDR